MMQPATEAPLADTSDANSLRGVTEGEAKAVAMAHEVVALHAARKQAEQRAAVAQRVVDALRSQQAPLQEECSRLAEEKQRLTALVDDLRRQLSDGVQREGALQRKLNKVQRPPQASVPKPDLRLASLEIETDALREENAKLKERLAILQLKRAPRSIAAVELSCSPVCQSPSQTEGAVAPPTTSEEAVPGASVAAVVAAAGAGPEPSHETEGVAALRAERDVYRQQVVSLEASLDALEATVKQLEAERRGAGETEGARRPAGGLCPACQNGSVVDCMQHDAALRNALLSIANQRQQDLEELLATRGAECRAMALRVQSLEQRLREGARLKEAWLASGRARAGDVRDALAGVERRMVALETVLHRTDPSDW
eukprot:GGOE01002941.1.p1 GENE.GGOE01002941.1~~GGOE01002941.1.p1  ORF type:complete len:371 (-),score=90.76 GGOE01002941.1:215-1327(-)